MSISAEVVLTCELCGHEQNEELEPDRKPEELAEAEGWGYADNDMMLKDLLCPDCLEEADDDG